MEFKKNDSVTVSVTDMGQDGEGIGKAEGYTLFIKDAVVGDKVRAEGNKSKEKLRLCPAYGGAGALPGTGLNRGAAAPDSAAAARSRRFPISVSCSLRKRK